MTSSMRRLLYRLYLVRVSVLLREPHAEGEPFPQFDEGEEARRWRVHASGS